MKRSAGFILLLLLMITTQLYPQMTDYIGDEEFLRSRRPVKSNINLGMDLAFTQINQHYSKQFYTVVDDEMLQLAFAVRGYFPITKNLRARVYLPYLIKAGISEDEQYPDYAEPLPGINDYFSNDGFGDFMIDFDWNILDIDDHPVRLVTHLGLLLATGESRYHSGYKGYLPLGSGFHSVHLGTGISRFLSYNFLLFTNGGYIHRFPRTFSPTRYNSGRLHNGEKYEPGEVFYVRAGLGMRLNFISYGQIVNLETEYISVGETGLGDIMISDYPMVESPYQVLRAGIKFLARQRRGESSYFFIGMEKRYYDGDYRLFTSDGDDDVFLFDVSLPLVIRFLNYNF
ncbi:hypothetical protein GF337_15000 [candidate division KSB1 bacterium]|nr:hypothetical protein [candidate division KSB1 bacterium]